MDSLEEFFFESSLDGGREPYLLWLPSGAPKALVVGLHTWSADRFNQTSAMLPFCRARTWALLLPEFRGPNLTSNPRARDAGGSALARRDIVDATRQVLSAHFPEQTPVFLLGGSGGGHMSLLVAGREEFQWSAISSWCPITDLAAWHRENPNYAPHIAAVCGGVPGVSVEVDAEYRERSPLHYAAGLAGCRLLLAHGRQDQSVPYTHSWRLAQAIEECGPKAFYFYLFDGGHEAHLENAFHFFDETMAKQAQEGLTG